MPGERKGGTQPPWYKDAIIYELHVKCFHDGDGDGIGDFKGLTEKLDYLSDLGVNTLWLLPFYPSPLRDDGYDIADYTAINPRYGTLADFRKFLRAAHDRDIRVITELVINHTSDRHPWFQRARKAPPGSWQRNFYVFGDNPDRYAQARIIFKDFEASNWTWDPVAKAYYWHRFYAHQPDLNFENPRVRRELIKIMYFWLDMGVDGLRLDAVPYLYEAEGTNCENLPATHDFLRQLRAAVDARHGDRMLLAEANQWPEDAAAYFGRGDACHMAFHFPIMPRMFLALQMEDRFPLTDILEQTPPIPDTCQWAIFLRNHDELTLEMVTDEERDFMYRRYAPDPGARINLGIRRRLAPLLSNTRRRIELLNVLLFTLPGSPVLYYGDEIGMGDNFHLGDRDGVRTPMQWSADRNAGFSRANPQRLYLPVVVDPEYHYEAVNVDVAERNPGSLLWWTRRLISLRKAHPALGRGGLRFVPCRNPRVLAYVRADDDETLLVVVNLSRFSQAASLDLSAWSGLAPRDLWSREDFPLIGPGPTPFTLTPHGYFLFSLHAPPAGTLRLDDAPPDLGPAFDPARFLDHEARTRLAAEVLPTALSRLGVVREEKDGPPRIELLEALPVGATDHPAWLLLAVSHPLASPPATHVLIVSAVTGEAARTALTAQAPRIVCRFTAKGEPGALLEGFLPDADCSGLLGLFARSRTLAGRGGQLTVGLAKPRRDLAPGGQARATAYESGQFASRLVINDQVVIKFFRGLEPDAEPDTDLARRVGRARPPLGPAVHGTLRYRRAAGGGTVAALVETWSRHETDVEDMIRQGLNAFFERVLSGRDEMGPCPTFPASPVAAARNWPPRRVDQVYSGFTLDLMDRLGRELARLHRFLSDQGPDPLYAPEPYTRLYQRSVFQDLQARLKAGLGRLAEILPRLDQLRGEQAGQLIGLRREWLEGLRRLLDHDVNCLKIRVHGAIAPRRILCAGKGFLFASIEDGRGRPLSARRIKRSGLRDVADLLRALDRSTRSSLASSPVIRSEDIPTLAPWALSWRDAHQAALLAGYLADLADTGLLPAAPSDTELLLWSFLTGRIGQELRQACETGDGRLDDILAAALELAAWPPGKKSDEERKIS